jgi:hypothetical protein
MSTKESETKCFHFSDLINILQNPANLFFTEIEKTNNTLKKELENDDTFLFSGSFCTFLNPDDDEDELNKRTEKITNTIIKNNMNNLKNLNMNNDKEEK